MIKWRLIYSGFLNGYENMALDESLLLNFEEGDSPVLRFYGWEPASVSIGCFQKTDGFLDIGRCTDKKTPIVRRITGGGMIYHHQELTYSIVCTADQLGVARKPTEAYRKICGFLLEFYRRLGLDADYAVNRKDGKLGRRENFCFAANEQFDIVINDKKIGGNAQKWTKNKIFQHGSIPVVNCLKEASELLLSKPERMMQSSISLRELDINDSYSDMFSMMRGSFFAETYESELTRAETDTMQKLLTEKYNKDS